MDPQRVSKGRALIGGGNARSSSVRSYGLSLIAAAAAFSCTRAIEPDLGIAQTNRCQW